MKRVSIVCLVAILLTASMASAASIWIRPTGDGAGNWNDSANWNPFVPVGTYLGDDEFGDPIYSTVIDGGVPSTLTSVTRTGLDADLLAEILVSDSQTFGDQLRHGYNDVESTDGPLLRIMDGGTLTGNALGKVSIGRKSKATVTVDAGGVFTPLHRIYVGYEADGTLNVAGTVNVTTGNPSRFYVGGNDIAGGIDGNGYVNVLDGGVLNLRNNKLYFMQGLIDIAGSGIITFAGGNMVDEIDVLIAADQISGNGILGNVLATYDGTNTTVEVLPEPATMILLGLGGMLIRKRR